MIDYKDRKNLEKREQINFQALAQYRSTVPVKTVEADLEKIENESNSRPSLYISGSL